MVMRCPDCQSVLVSLYYQKRKYDENSKKSIRTWINSGLLYCEKDQFVTRSTVVHFPKIEIEVKNNFSRKTRRTRKTSTDTAICTLRTNNLNESSVKTTCKACEKQLALIRLSKK